VVNPTLTAYVYIDNRVAAALARTLITSFGFVADRQLGEGLRVTAEVAEWAVDRSGGFCEWLAREPLPSARRARILVALPACSARLSPEASGGSKVPDLRILPTRRARRVRPLARD